MTARLDLGSLQLEDTRSGARVRLSSHANLAPSEKDDIVRLQSLLIDSTLIEGRGVIPWVRVEEHILLIVSLSPKDGASELMIQEVIDNVSALLSDIKAWERLGLEISSIQRTRDSLDGSKFELRLKRTMPDQQTTTKPHHKLGSGRPISDTCPPTNVEYSTAVSFHIHMSISGSKCSWPAGDPKPLNLPPKSSLYVREDIEYLDLDSSEDDMLDIIGPGPDPRTSPASSELFEVDGVARSHEETEEILEDICWGAEVSLSHDSTLQFPSVPQNGCQYHKTCTARLIAAALEAAILGPSKRRQHDVEITVDEHQRLACIVPSLWLRGYLRSIAENAVFLPTIAHAINNVSGENVASRLLRNKLRELNSNRDLPSSPSAISKFIEGRLWKIMEGAIFDKQKAKSPKLMWPSSMMSLGSQLYSDDILEPCQEEYLGLEHSDKDDNTPTKGLFVDDLSEESPDGMMEYEDFYITDELDSMRHTVSTPMNEVRDVDEQFEAGGFLLDEELSSTCSSADMLSLLDMDTM